MMKILRILLTTLLFTNCTEVSKTQEALTTDGSVDSIKKEKNYSEQSTSNSASLHGNVIGVWKFIYPHNTQNLNENHYIVFKNKEGTIQGWYYGTSDDFDEAREGYFPGFFVSEMSGLEILRDSISFKLEVKNDQVFTDPIPLDIESYKSLEMLKWDYGLRFNSRKYSGRLAEDSLILKSQDIDRVFIKVPLLED